MVEASDAPHIRPERSARNGKAPASKWTTRSRVLPLQHGAEVVVGEHLDLLDLVGRSEAIEDVQERHPRFDAGDWQFVEPVGQLSDSKTEDYDFRVPLTAAAQAGTMPVSNDHVIVVRAYDRFDKLATAKVVIRSK
jgi:hypothetical protein